MEDYRQRLLTAKPSPADPRDYNIAMFTPVQATFPDEFCLKFTEKIKDQGNIGSCVAQSLAYTREITEESQSGEFKEFSVGFIYANRIGTLGDIFGAEGMVPRDALQNLQKYGDVLLQDFPENDTYPKVRALLDKRQELYPKALPYKVTAYVKLSTIEEIKTALMTLGPVTAMFPIHDSFYKITNSNAVVPEPAGSFLGYHEMTIVGWRKDNTFITLNSWGDGWGDRGKCYVPFTFPVVEYWSITDKEMPHWAEKYYNYLNNNGVTIHDKRFDDQITRGEVMAMLARMKGAK